METFLGLRIPADLKAKLEGLAKEDRRPLSDYVRMLLEDAVKDEFRRLAARKGK